VERERERERDNVSSPSKGERERESPPLILERECLPLVKDRGRERGERGREMGYFREMGEKLGITPIYFGLNSPYNFLLVNPLVIYHVNTSLTSSLPKTFKSISDSISSFKNF